MRGTQQILSKIIYTFFYARNFVKIKLAISSNTWWCYNLTYLTLTFDKFIAGRGYARIAKKFDRLEEGVGVADHTDTTCYDKNHCDKLQL